MSREISAERSWVSTFARAMTEAGVDRLKIQEQLGMSKASYYRCLKVA
jgi:hypothetical protein